MSREEHDEPTARSMLGRGSAWFSEAKRTLVDKAEEFGEVEDLWTSLEGEADEMESILRRESPETYKTWRGQIGGTVDYLCSMDPTDPTTFWDKPVIEAAVFTGTATSGSPIVSTSYPLIRTEPWTQLQSGFGGFSERRDDRERVCAMLSRLSPRLENQFRQVWQTWGTATRDRRKPAMYELRDTVQDVVLHLSEPGGRFKAPSVAEGRKARVAWIANHLVSGAAAAALMGAHADSYPQLYRGLSRAHEARYDEHEAFALLLEGQSFLLELLSSLDWQTVEEYGLCHGKS
jgi:hypothetical protein